MKSPYSQFNKSVVSVSDDGNSTHTANDLSKQGRLSVTPILLALAVLYIGYLHLSGSGTVIDDVPYIDDIVLPDEKEEDKSVPDDVIKVDLKDSYLVKVYETEAQQGDTWFVKLMDDDAFWFDWIESKGMRMFFFDPDSNPEQSESFVKAAEARGVKKPFILHAKGGKVLNVIPIEESLTTDKIKELIAP